MKKTKNIANLKKIVLEYGTNNAKEYILIILIFIIGIFMGVMFINNCSENSEQYIINYISDFIIKFKEIDEIDIIDLVCNSIKKNILLAVIMWIAGTTIIGMPIVLLIIFLKGFSMGYAISAVTLSLGVLKGIIFNLILFFLQNIVLLPAIITMGVSSLKLCKSIINDRRKENIKIKIVKHTCICLIMFICLVIASFIENCVLIKLLKLSINIFN